MSYPQGRVERVPLPQVPTPIFPEDIANKAYVDAIPPSGGETFARVVKKVDQIVNNSTVFVADDELFFTPLINKTYHIMILLDLISPGTADFKQAATIAVGATAERGDGSWSGVPHSMIDWTVGLSKSTSGINQAMEYHGRLIMGGTAGNFVVTWAQQIAQVVDTKVLQGSLLVAWEELP